MKDLMRLTKRDCFPAENADITRTLVYIVTFFLFTSVGLAERVYTFTTSVAAVGSVDDNPRVSGLFSQFGEGYVRGYGLYPTLSLASPGQKSEFQVSYAFGLSRYDSDLDIDSESHGITGDLTAEITPRFLLNFSNSFRRSPDFTAFNFLRGIVFSPEGVFFDTETIALRRGRWENTAAFDLESEITPRSSLSFGLAHSVRDFESDPLFRERRASQNQYNGSLHFIRQVNQHTDWTLGYSATQFDFREFFRDARTHDVSLGVNHKLGPTMTVSASAGPSYTEFLGAQDVSNIRGYNANVNFSKTFEEDQISFFYSRRNGATLGVGGLVKTHRLGFHFSKALGTRLTLDFGTSVFQSDRLLDDPIVTKGLRSSLVLGFLLSTNWSVELGGNYQSQQGRELFFDLDRRNAFVSIRFTLPELWRFSR